MTTYKTPVWSTGERLRKAREDAGLSQERMAELLSTPERPVSKQTVSNWEKNRNQPRDFMARLDQWAEVTDYPTTWLLGLPGQEPACVTEDRNLALLTA